MAVLYRILRNQQVEKSIATAADNGDVSFLYIHTYHKDPTSDCAESLYDEIGFLNDAIAIAAKKAKLDSNYKIVEYPQIQKTFFEKMVEGIMLQQNEEEDSAMIKMNSETRYLYNIYNKFKSIFTQEGVQAKMMWEFDFD